MQKNGGILFRLENLETYAVFLGIDQKCRNMRNHAELCGSMRNYAELCGPHKIPR